MKLSYTEEINQEHESQAIAINQLGDKVGNLEKSSNTG